MRSRNMVARVNFVVFLQWPGVVGHLENRFDDAGQKLATIVAPGDVASIRSDPADGTVRPGVLLRLGFRISQASDCSALRSWARMRARSSRWEKGLAI